MYYLLIYELVNGCYIRLNSHINYSGNKRSSSKHQAIVPTEVLKVSRKFCINILLHESTSIHLIYCSNIEASKFKFELCLFSFGMTMKIDENRFYCPTLQIHRIFIHFRLWCCQLSNWACLQMPNGTRRAECAKWVFVIACHSF